MERKNRVGVKEGDRGEEEEEGQKRARVRIGLKCARVDSVYQGLSALLHKVVRRSELQS